MCAHSPFHLGLFVCMLKNFMIIHSLAKDTMQVSHMHVDLW